MHWTRKFRIVAPSLACVGLILLFGPSGACARDEKSATPEHKELLQRIDFGNAHILGQSLKSGAVYLMHRKKSEIKSMLKVRQNYRQEIMEDFSLEKTAIADKFAQGPDAPRD